MATAASGESKLRGRARVAANTIWDHFSRPTARKPEDIPWCADAVSAEWLTPILCSGHPGAEVTSVQVDGGSSGSSVRRRIGVTYNAAGKDAGLVDSFFAKATPTLLTRLSSAMAAGQEANFFRTLRPELPIEAPVHRYSDYDLKTGRSIHLFEDLVATRGAQFCNYATVIDRDQAEQAVDLLALLHGRHYASPRLEQDLKWIPPYEAFFGAMEYHGVHAGHDQARRVAAHVIPPDVAERWDEIWPMTLLGLQAHVEEPRTIIHSDVHLGNWYVTADGVMGLCDWQCIGAGHWARDFAYAMGTILAPEDRRNWQDDLLARYLERLREHGGPKVGFDAAWTRYRQQTFAALLMWTPTLCHPPTMPDMQPEAMSLEMIRRLTAAISDLEAFESQPSH
jgi:hypothetical protein